MTEASELINGSNPICHYTRFSGFSKPNCNSCNVGDTKMVELLHLFAENRLKWKSWLGDLGGELYEHALRYEKSLVRIIPFRTSIQRGRRPGGGQARHALQRPHRSEEHTS